MLKQQAHSQRVTMAEFSPDGALIATGAEDGKVTLQVILLSCSHSWFPGKNLEWKEWFLHCNL